MKVLVLTGPESSGKSWLSELIRANFGGVLVGEYVRHFIEHEQRDTREQDQDAECSTAAAGLAGGGAAQGGRELGVLGIEGALHLLQQTLLVLGQWHRGPPLVGFLTG